jgi:ribosomal protein RSM22 (predicted rRNA methylase)
LSRFLAKFFIEEKESVGNGWIHKEKREREKRVRKTEREKKVGSVTVVNALSDQLKFSPS